MLIDQKKSGGGTFLPLPQHPGSYGIKYVMRQNHPINVGSSDIDVIDAGKKYFTQFDN